ncbi:hypothetical protein D3C76_1364760 [compost metagenome]
MIVIEVQPRYGVTGFWYLRLFLDRQHTALLVEFGYAVALWIMHVISKYRRPYIPAIGAQQQRLEIMAVENVVAQYQGGRIITDEIRADSERLRQAVRARLHGIGKVQAPLRTIAQQLLEARCVLWRGDDEDVANTCQQ